MTYSWIHPLFREYKRTLKRDATTRFAFSRAIKEALEHSLLKASPTITLSAALRESNWIVVEHELRALANHLLQTLPEEILQRRTDTAWLKEKSAVICGLRLLADQAHCFRNMETTQKKR